MTVVSSHNDWDPLEECFVGIADHARIPTVDKSTHSFGFADCKWEHIKDLEGPSPEWVIDEANEDLDGLAKLLSNLGVKVRRPEAIDHSKEFSSLSMSMFLMSDTNFLSRCSRLFNSVERL